MLKKVSSDRQHGSARWSCAGQLLAQSPRGEVVTAQAARGKMGKIDPPRGRASDLYAPALRIVYRRIPYAAIVAEVGGYLVL